MAVVLDEVRRHRGHRHNGDLVEEVVGDIAENTTSLRANPSDRWRAGAAGSLSLIDVRSTSHQIPDGD